ncbi:MAG: molybdopterin-dependent oxidoreductase [Thermodesulfobacteriota bacterium]|nr:molybdopterin-dependent oxidoreductase [Thermodesulfobacteriota bacterium]
MSNKSENAMVNLTIDGQDVQIEAGATIIVAAEKLGIKIPTMCYLKKLSTTGACRVCLVEVEGVVEPITACNTVATEGIVVTTQSDKIERMRKDMIRLMLVNHPLDCPVCDAAGECDLQDICFDFHVLDQPYSAEDVAMPKVTDWPLIENIPSRCILCEKCVKVGHELTGIGDFCVTERGDKAYIGRNPDNEIDPYIEGNAVAVCPVGAMISKPFKHASRCWTLDKMPSIGFSGGSLEQVDLNVKQNKLFRITSKDDVTINDGMLSFDSSFGYGFVNAPERLLQPTLKQQVTDWETAQKAILAKAKEVGGAAVAGLSSARLTVEENYLFQKLFRAGFGSNNIDSDARFGMLKASDALKQTLGLRGASAGVDKIADADAVLVFGSDITSEQPQVNYQIQRALRQNDAQLVVANMRNVRIAGLSNSFLNYTPGSEALLAGALTKLIVANGQANNAFVKKYVKNTADIKKVLAGVDVKKAVAATGVSLELLQDAAVALGEASSVAIIFGADVTKSAQCVEITKALANLALVTGALSADGGGMLPVDEKPNMQGLLDAGVCPEYLPGYQGYAGAAAKFAKGWNVAALPEGGMNALEILTAIESGSIRFLYLAGTNPLVTFADSGRWKKALNKVEFLVVQDILASELTQMADVVLPAAAYAEKSGTYIACDHRAGMLGKSINPAGESRSDKQIFAELYGALNGSAQTLCNQEILAEMAELSGLFSSVEVTGDIYTSSCAKAAYTPAAASLIFSPFAKVKAVKGLQLLTGKMHAHTGVTSTYAAGAMDIAPAGYIEISQQDADTAGVVDGVQVTVKSAVGSATGVARVSSYVPQGVLFAPYHFAQLNAQQVVPVGQNMVSVEVAKV